MTTYRHMADCPATGALEWATSAHPAADTATCDTCGHEHPTVDL